MENSTKQVDNILIENIYFGINKYTIISVRAEGWTELPILINDRIDKEFNKQFYDKFSEFELYDYKGELNIEQADFINNYFKDEI